MPLDAATSFQESGIFDTSCELVHVTTQTDLVSEGAEQPALCSCVCLTSDLLLLLLVCPNEIIYGSDLVTDY